MANFHRRSKRKRGVILSPIGWQRLQTAQKQSEIEANRGHPYTLENLNELTGLSLHPISKVLRCQIPVDQRTLQDYFSAFHLTLTPKDYTRPTAETGFSREPITPLQQDWGEAIDVSVFYGRTEELATLEQWIVTDHCRLLGVLGMGGIGKTALAVKIAQQLQEQFEYIIWRSLRNAPPLENLLGEIIPFLSSGQETQVEIKLLLQYLRSFRSLIILDNVETILQPRECAGEYRHGYENYGQLFKLIGETAHSSCLMLTSREKPAEVAALQGIDLAVRSLQLKGSAEAAQKLIQAKRLSGSEEQKQILGDRYGSNPLALKIVATSIQDLFDGDIEIFLAQDIAVFNSIQKLLDQQFERLSPLEKTIMYWLAINREWTTIAELLEDIVPKISKGNLLEALESLIWRSLIEKQSGTYTQQPVVMEYVTKRLIEQITCEIIQASSPLPPSLGQHSLASYTDVGSDRCSPATLPLFRSYALIKATTKDYIRESQIRLILEPIAEQLYINFGCLKAIEQQLQKILKLLQDSQKPLSGYGGGNLINLAHHLQIDLTGYDFAHLTVWQAYLQGANLHEVNFAHSNLTKSVFTQIFGSILSVTLSPNGKLLAMGDSKGEIRLYQVVDGQEMLTCRGHTNWVLSVTFSPDSKFLASGSGDFSVKLWEIQSGRCCHTFKEHTNWVRSVVFSPDGKLLASSSEDSLIRLWDVQSGKCCHTFKEHTNRILSVAFSPDGQLLASGNGDFSVRLWNVQSGKCCHTFKGHTSSVRSVVFNPDGKLLASGSEDSSIRLWNVQSGKCCHTFKGHTNRIRAVVFNPDGKLLASGSEDSSIRLWNVQSGKCCHTFKGHTSRVWSVAFSPNGKLLASGSEDSSVRLWDAAQSRLS